MNYVIRKRHTTVWYGIVLYCNDYFRARAKSFILCLGSTHIFSFLLRKTSFKMKKKKNKMRSAEFSAQTVQHVKRLQNANCLLAFKLNACVSCVNETRYMNFLILALCIE